MQLFCYWYHFSLMNCHDSEDWLLVAPSEISLTVVSGALLGTAKLSKVGDEKYSNPSRILVRIFSCDNISRR